MTRTAAIDVLVPVFNAADTLDASLESLAAQSFEDFRVILVDDGSTDGSPAILAGWAARDPRFEVVTKPNGGIVDALNLGLERASAPLVARLDGDDISLAPRFERQKAYLDENPDCVAVGCRVEHIDENDRPVSGLPQPGPPEQCDFDRLPAREPYIVHPFLMARRQAMVAAGGYRRVPHSEDSDLYWRLSERGRLHNLEDVLGRYRLHSASISGSSILNGRVMAIGSQLGALAARRRAAEGRDIAFAANLVPVLRDAASLTAMCTVVADLVGDREMPRFRLAVGMKLLELCSYRPYLPELEDCRFIRAAFAAAAGEATPANRRDMRWHLTGIGAHLFREGRLREAMALLPPAMLPRAMAKTVRGG